jgi:hypothetical protein
MTRLLLALSALLAAALACSPNVTINVPRVTTGPTQTVTVSEPRPSGERATELVIRMGAGRLELAPGGEGLVDGTIEYNVAEWKPDIVRGDGRLTIEQGRDTTISGLPGEDVINDWKLRLGDVPLDLSIEAGAYKGTLALGGLRLESLTVKDGASDADITFDSPNQTGMELLSYGTGASQVELSGLANANFARMEFEGGFGSYTLDFGGTLQRDASVRIESGASSLRVVIPSGTNAVVTVSGGLNNVDTEGEWSQSGDTYTAAGSGPTLTIEVELGAGNLDLVRK